ncbi:MAG: dihydroorotate dehydrogenase electron transfer subunit [Thermodesulfobacteriota bacterium]
MVKAAWQQSDDPFLPRPFSVHWADSESLEILYKVVGRGTRFLSRLRSGDRLTVYGPLGRGFTVKPAGEYLVIGGGIGVAPLLFLARSIRKNQPESHLHIVIGARCSDEIVAADRFESLGRSSVKLVTEDGSRGLKGLVTDLLSYFDFNNNNLLVYSCGPMPMLKAVSRWCRGKDWPCQVSIETVMACGIGACLGCAVEGKDELNGKYLHVCSDGPVFDSGRLW